MAGRGRGLEHGRGFWDNLEVPGVLTHLGGPSRPLEDPARLYDPRAPPSRRRRSARSRLDGFSGARRRKWCQHGATPDVTSVRSGSGLRRERRLERPEGTAPCPRRHRSTGTSWRSRWGRSRWGPWPGSGTCWAGNWRRRASTRRTWCWGSSWCCARTRSCSGSGSRRRAGPTPNRAATAQAACASGATPSSEPPPQKLHPQTPPCTPKPPPASLSPTPPTPSPLPAPPNLPSN